MNHFGESRISISQVLNFVDLVFNFSVSRAGLMTDSYFIVLSISPSLFSFIVLKCSLIVESLLISLCQMSLSLFANRALVLKLQAHCLDEVPLWVKSFHEKLAVSSWRTEAGSFPLLCPLWWVGWSRDLPSIQFHFSKQNFENKILINAYSQK